MLEPLWDVAPPWTWAILTLASTFLLAGFVLLSHTLVRSKAYGDDFSGLTHPGRLEWTVRLGVATLALGFGLWAFELSAPLWVLVSLGVVAAAALGLEAVALTKRAS